MHIKRLNVSKLEHRIDDLESENRRLRNQISDLLPFYDTVGFYADNMDIALQRAERAEAEAERLLEESVRLQCCANCGQPHSLSLGECYSRPAATDSTDVPESWEAIEPDWTCQFSPSRWVARDASARAEGEREP